MLKFSTRCLASNKYYGICVLEQAHWSPEDPPPSCGGNIHTGEGQCLETGTNQAESITYSW